MNSKEAARAKYLVVQARRVALVMILTALLWLAGNVFGEWVGLAGRYAFLIDFAAIAAFAWVMFVTYQLWRAGKT